MTRLILLALATLVLCPAPARPATPENLPGDLAEDLGALPAVANLYWLLGGTALTVFAHEIEDPDGAARALDGSAIDPVVDFGNIWGGMEVQAPLALGCWAYGGLAGHEGFAALGYDLTRSLLLTSTVTGVIKHTADRTRPNGETLSFPSGHAASAFSAAGVISRHHGAWAGAATVGLGVLTGLGRMEDRKHYASDVVAGATIGWVIGRTVARGGAGATGLSLVPVPGGIMATGRF